MWTASELYNKTDTCLLLLDALGARDHHMVHVRVPVHSGTLLHTFAVMLVLLLVRATAVAHRRAISET